MSTWPLQSGAPRIQSLTFQSPGGVQGVQLALPSAVHTPGAWTELNAATPAAESFLMQVQYDAQQDNRFLFSVGIGAPGSVVPLIEHVGLQVQAFRPPGASWHIPLRIPAGTRLWGRFQTSDLTAVNAGGGWPYMDVQAVPPSARMPVGFTRCETVGVNLATTSGTPLDVHFADGGVINEIVAATARSCRAVLPSFVNGALTGYLTLFTGVALTERWIDRVWYNANSPGVMTNAGPLIPASLAAGSRIGGRFTFLNSTQDVGTILHLFS